MSWKPANEVADAKAARKARQAFYTPLALASRLAEVHLEVWPGGRYLEPSAGDGRMVHALRSLCGECVIDACEIESAMHERIVAAGGTLVAGDFLKWSPGEVYDGVLMNPPFTKRQDQRHVEHAYSLLKPGGRLVSITSTTLPDAMREQSLSLPGCRSATYERIGSGEFKDFGTSIEVAVVVVDKPHPSDSDDPTDAVILALETSFTGRRSSNPSRWSGIDSAESLKAKFCRELCELGCSCYGVDWGRVWSELTESEAAPPRRVRRSMKQIPLIAMGDPIEEMLTQ